MIDKNFVSRICPIDLHDQTAKITISIPTEPVTTRCENSISTSGSYFIWN